MARVVYHTSTPLAVSVTLFARWGSSLGIWGFGAGTAALFLLSVTPLVKRELLVKLPLLGRYYEDNTPASDKPF
ncbi:hypothetical protein BD410DRAFT_714114 [Rickenella mellea]|uniref:Uncharacterized protein n=1 Tax=Rickenella mellea TaxID=50990 RepID=A0A4Y7QIW1_9AGAM|nr:hypothetical protein BD410DRAFT_714114 [Rickenella mellea]